MVIIPLQAVPAQTVFTTLGTQTVMISVYQRFFGLFLDLYLRSTPSLGSTMVPIIIGALCQNLNVLVRSVYLGFSGDLAFQDTQGTDPPFYTGLDNRFQLLWLSPDDLAALDANWQSYVDALAGLPGD